MRPSITRERFLAVQARHDEETILNAGQRRQNLIQPEGAITRLFPCGHGKTVADIHGAETTNPGGRRTTRREGGHHGIEERQRYGGAHPAQDGPS